MALFLKQQQVSINKLVKLVNRVLISIHLAVLYNLPQTDWVGNIINHSTIAFDIKVVD